MERRQGWRLGLVLALVPVLLVSGGCLPFSTPPLGDDLPTLRPLDGGYAYYGDATWSPNGRWIALLAGPNMAGGHLMVLSPDGRCKQDLSGWGCGDTTSFSFAWLPDSTLSCLNDTELLLGAYPFRSAYSMPVVPALTPEDKGLSWAPDGSVLIDASAAAAAAGDPERLITNGRLYLVHRDGTVSLPALTPTSDEVWYPAWASDGSALAYLLETNPDTGKLDLMLAPVARGHVGQVVLGSPRTLASDVDQHYSWAPSGHWIAVRYASYQGGDKISLLNPANPAQTVDVVRADQVGQQMMNPIWSADGRTMIVFSVAYDASQPYELDIGAYLQTKGLQM